MSALKTSRVVTQSLNLVTLQSWRFLLLLALVPLLWTAVMPVASLMRGLLAISGAAAVYNLWRVWLDCQYLQCFSAANNRAAGRILAVLWRKQPLTRLSYRQRRRGALRQLRRSALLTVILWVVWLGVLLVS